MTSEHARAEELFAALREYAGDDMALDAAELDDLRAAYRRGDTSLQEIEENLPEGFRLT